MAVQATQPSSRRLGRYEVIAEIARGGMGTVLLARLAGAGGFQRLFALKLLHQRYLDDPEFVQMLLDEARIAARINHPNVVSIQEVEESAEHGYFLVMDYVEGFTLADLSAAAGPLAWARRARIVIRVVLDSLQGLEAAHNLVDDYGSPLNVVHRDVSPQNILVGVNGIARVTDFGIAKAAARMTSTRVGQVKGKLAYMSPEQARGKSTDARTDVWAMGVVLWEALAGRRLFRVENESETYQRVLMAPIPRLIDVVRDAPVAIADVVGRALDREASRRFGSAREMAVALEAMARAHDLLADAHEIGHWIRTTFAAQLKLRQNSIRMASDGRGIPSPRLAALPGGLSVPQLPEESVSLTISPPPGPPDEGAFADLPTDDFSASDTMIVQGRRDTNETEIEESMEDVSTDRVSDHGMSTSVQKALATLREVQGEDVHRNAPVATRRAPRAINAPKSGPPPAHAAIEDDERFDETAAVPLVSSLRAPTRPVSLDPARAMAPSVRAAPRSPAKSLTGLAVAMIVVALASGTAAGWMLWHRAHPTAGVTAAPR
ncbi:MAG: serine/threonine-protein kinase [Deltaproteobacteria bacterium]